jgi:type I restriction enzyme R subunit
MRLLPAETAGLVDLEGALKLEFYKLEQTFRGDIDLVDQSGVYDPASSKGKATPEPKEPLNEVIQKINDLYNGNFTDADRVMLYALHDKLKEDKKLRKIAKSADPQVFAESIFPKTFDTVAQDSYVEQTEAFTSLFENKNKYNAVMAALAGMLYREFNT